MKKVYLCPECHNELEEITGCGTQSFFCGNCKKLISRKNIIDQEIKDKENTSHVK